MNTVRIFGLSIVAAAILASAGAVHALDQEVMDVARRYGVVKAETRAESTAAVTASSAEADAIRVTVQPMAPAVIDQLETVENAAVKVSSAQALQAGQDYSHLTLSLALELAVQNNYALMAKEYDLLVADQTIGQALTYTGPRFRLQHTRTFLGETASIAGMSLGDDRVNISKLVLQQALYTFGKAESALRLAKHDKALKKVILEMGRQDLLLQTIQAYANVLKASKGVQVAQENVSVFKEHLALVQAQFNSGMVLETDVLMTKVRHLEARQKLIEASNARDLSIKYLCNLLVIGVPKKLTLEDLPEIADITPAHDGIFEQAEKNLPELRQMKKVVEINREQVTLAIKMKNPDIGIQGSYDSGNQYNEHDSNWNATIAFDALIFDCGNLQRDVKKARLNLEKSFKMLEDARQNVRFGIDAAYQKVEETHDQMNLAREIIKTSEVNAEKTRFQYKNGTTINTDVLNAELSLSSAKFGFNNSRYDFVTSQASLFRSAGLISLFVENLEKDNNNKNKENVEVLD